MDMFDVFSGTIAQSKNSKPSETPKKANGGGLTRRCGIVVSLREESLLFFDDESVKEVFIPRTQIKDWWFTTDGSKRNLTLGDLELDDEVTLVIPVWLAKKEKML